MPVDGKVFALTFGMGHLLLDQSRVTPGFGFGIAIRMLKPDAVRQVTHSMMDARGRTDRNSAAQDQHIQGFGIEEYGEVVSRLAGKLSETSLTLSKGRRQAAKHGYVCLDRALVKTDLHPRVAVVNITTIPARPR